MGKWLKMGVVSLTALLLVACGETGAETVTETEDERSVYSTEEVDKDGEDDKKVSCSPPKVDIEDVVDRTEDPWSDGYVPDDSNLNFITLDSFEEKVESGERFVLYLGRVTCPYAHRYRQVQDPALELLDEDLYSLDTEYYRDNEKLAELREQLGNEYVPDVMLIEDGEVLDSLQSIDGYDEFSVDELSEWLDSLLK